MRSESHAHHHDAFHVEEHRSPGLRELPINFWTLGRIPILAIIRAYQLTISRLIPSDTCRFYPTCSHYGYQAIFKHGFIKGWLMGGWRVLRCNPVNNGGVDPVPDNWRSAFKQKFTST
jgi:hypothetical protein